MAVGPSQGARPGRGGFLSAGPLGIKVYVLVTSCARCADAVALWYAHTYVHVAHTGISGKFREKREKLIGPRAHKPQPCWDLQNQNAGCAAMLMGRCVSNSKRLVLDFDSCGKYCPEIHPSRMAGVALALPVSFRGDSWKPRPFLATTLVALMSDVQSDAKRPKHFLLLPDVNA